MLDFNLFKFSNEDKISLWDPKKYKELKPGTIWKLLAFFAILLLLLVLVNLLF